MSLTPLFYVLLPLLLFDTSSPDSDPLLLIATILLVHHSIGLLLAARGNNSPAKLKLTDGWAPIYSQDTDSLIGFQETL